MSYHSFHGYKYKIYLFHYFSLLLLFLFLTANTKALESAERRKKNPRKNNKTKTLHLIHLPIKHSLVLFYFSFCFYFYFFSSFCYPHTKHFPIHVRYNHILINYKYTYFKVIRQSTNTLCEQWYGKYHLDLHADYIIEWLFFFFVRRLR